MLTKIGLMRGLSCGFLSCTLLLILTITNAKAGDITFLLEGEIERTAPELESLQTASSLDEDRIGPRPARPAGLFLVVGSIVRNSSGTGSGAVMRECGLLGEQ